MLLASLYVVIGIALLYVGGEALVRGAAALARRLGMRPLVIGLTVVAFGTSAPELAVTLDAALSNYGDVALGNVVGSNLCNLALILPLALLCRPVAVQPQLLRRELPAMLLATVLVLGLLADGTIDRWEGVLCVALLAAYVVVQFRSGREPAGQESEVAVSAADPAVQRPRRQLVLIVAGLAMLAAGGYTVVHGGVALATAWGVPPAMIALTLFAVGTSLPELAASLVAAARGESDLALGNVVGSNLFNLLGVLGLTALVHPVARAGIDWGDLLAMLVMSLLLPTLILLGRRPRRLSRVDALLLLGAYALYLGWLVAAAR